MKLGDFRHVRWFPTHDVSVLVANALVSSWLDYWNSLFRSLSKFNLRILQCIQNSAVRIVSNTSRYTSITPVLKKLHWLPVEQCMVFKTATLVYKFLHTGFPRYLLHIFLPTAIRMAPGSAIVVVISLSFLSSTLLFINLSSSLVIVMVLMLPLFGMLFRMRFVPLHPWPLSESSLKNYMYTKALSIFKLAYIIPWCSPWCLTPFLSLDIEIWSTAFFAPYSPLVWGD